MVDLDNPALTGYLHPEIEQFYFAYRGFTDRADRILDRRGLGRVHHRILYFIGRRPDVSVRGLLDLLAVSKQALNAPLRQLMEMGLVGAEAGAQDRRVKNLRLTPQGRKLEAELTEAQTRHLRAAFDRAGAEAQRGWSAVMGELVKG
ncbi:MarR family transcriptional regulator [Caulobacter sp. Root487D2Y]|uniref:MarR family winged helix-turn-helix transcriptional regulator n=1 Tax=Caulobacter sp. Root487D2Y TaxID=1736547 RepID=UPI0006F4A612|nr:MarR family transcriptional regulator [Caulobacter sp. Root487D2Y]KQY29281.1 MarR family transcriptional regulator [Caulobacter sp. Root487D2Y]